LADGTQAARNPVAIAAAITPTISDIRERNTRTS
jgi:hypothetical protein